MTVPLGDDWQFAGYTHGPQSALGILTDVTEDAAEPPTLGTTVVDLPLHLTPLGEAFRRLGEQILAMRPWLDLLAELLAGERPVDRARRLRVDRAMRARARRARRHGRVLR